MRFHDLTTESAEELHADERWQPVVAALHDTRISAIQSHVPTARPGLVHRPVAELEAHLGAVGRALGAISLPLPADVLILRLDLPGPPVEVFPEPGAAAPIVVLAGFAPRSRMGVEFAAALVAWARWGGPEAHGPLARLARGGGWSRWDAARVVPLEEWIYTAGMGVHGALLAQPSLSLREVLGINAAAFGRLRRMEATLWSRLSDELGGSGLGAVMRWLADDAPASLRRASDGETIPAAAGRYLAWKMTAPRVERLGLAAAVSMAT